MYALVEWVDEKKFSVIAMSRVKEPRKDFDSYKEGDIVKASCPGFPGVHNAKLIAIRGDTTEDKKALERMAIQVIEDLVENEGEESVSNNQDKRKKKTNESRPTKKSKTKEKENQEDLKAEKQKKREDQERNKQIQLNKNRAFLDSLNSFKDSANVTSKTLPQDPPFQSPPPTPQTPYVLLDLDTMENLTSENIDQPMNDWIPLHQEPSRNWTQSQSQQVTWTPQRSNWTYTPQHLNNWTPSPQHTNNLTQVTQQGNNWTPQRFSQENPCTQPTLPQENHITPNRRTQCSESTPPQTSQPNRLLDFQNDGESCQACIALKRELERVTSSMKQLEQQLKSFKGQTTYTSQADGRPRAGLVPSDVANANHMIELMPGTSVYIYPKDLRVVMKKDSGCRKARYLLSVFYTNDELVEAGNLLGKNGKKGISKEVLQAILDYAVLKGDEKVAEINAALRSKVSALVCTKTKEMTKK